MGYLGVLLFRIQAEHFEQSVGRHLKNVQSQMYFDVHMPTAKNLGQYELEGDHEGQSESCQQQLDIHNETDPEPLRTADVYPSALYQDCGEELITLQLQKHLSS